MRAANDLPQRLELHLPGPHPESDCSYATWLLARWVTLVRRESMIDALERTASLDDVARHDAIRGHIETKIAELVRQVDLMGGGFVGSLIKHSPYDSDYLARKVIASENSMREAGVSGEHLRSGPPRS